ncbi:MAG TPA: hypothetical protein PLX67_03295, partial [bacterium]|nr:hypothetical protein [bacterium]
MFDEVNNQPTPASASQPTDNSMPNQAPAAPTNQATDGQVQDIFANGESPAANQPSGQPNFSQPFMPAGLPVTAQPVNQLVPKSGSNAKLILVVLVILILAGAAALVYLQYFKKTPPPIITPEAINVNSETEVTTTDEAMATATDETIVSPTSSDNPVGVDIDTINVFDENVSSTELDQTTIIDSSMPEPDSEAIANLDSDQ